MKKIILLLVSLFMSLPIMAQTNGGQLYIRLQRGHTISQSVLLQALSASDAALIEKVQPFCAPTSKLLSSSPELADWWVVSASSPAAMAVLQQKLQAVPFIAKVEPAYVYKPFSAPNDPLYTTQQYLQRIGAEEAWSSISNGTNTVTVAVIDDGVAWNHEDLAANIYLNAAETANGQDSDGNGRIDDIRGWDFVGNVSQLEASLGIFREDNNVLNIGSSHGTRAASVIGAVPNNSRGMAGLARRVKILPIKVAPDNPLSRDMYRIPEAIFYAIEQGAHVIYIGGGRTEQLPFTGFSQIEADVINEAVRRGIVVIAGAGNSAIVGDNRVYPATLPNVISVAAAANSDFPLRSSNSGYYASLFAPGEQVQSAINGNLYDNNFNGTSAAAALVTGAAALLKLQYPEWSPEKIRQQLLSSSSIIGAQRTPTMYGLLNVKNALHFNTPIGQFVPGIGKSNPNEWFSLLDQNGAISTAISNFESHIVQVKLRNYLATAENITVRLLPVGATRYAMPDTGYVPQTFTSWQTDEIKTLLFAVKADPSVLSDTNLQNRAQDFVIEVRAGNYVAYHHINVPIIAQGEGIKNIAVSPYLQLTNTNQNPNLIIRNIGSEQVTITAIQLQGDSQIEIVNPPTLPFNIPVNAVRTLSVRVTPSATGQFNAKIRTTFTLPPDEDENAPTNATITTTVDANIVANNLQLVGAQTREFPPTRVGDTASVIIQLRNTGTVPAQVQPIISGGENYRQGVFSLVDAPATIPAGATVSARALFIPQVAGRTEADIVLSTSSSADIASFRLSGQGLATTGRRPHFEVNNVLIENQQPIELPATRIGESAVIQNIVLVNPGRLTASVSQLLLEGIGATEFEILAPVGPFTIDAGGRTQVRIAFRPTISGPKSVTLTVKGGFDDVIARLFAVGGTPIAVVPPESSDEEVQTQYYLGIAFPTAVGTVGTGFVQLKNNRTTPLTISGAVFSGVNANEFRVKDQFPITLSPGEERDLDIEFRPLTEGAKEALLTISYNGVSLTDKVQFSTYAFGTRNVVVAEFPGGDPSGDYFQVFPTTVVGEASTVVRNVGLLNRGSVNEIVAASVVGANAADFVITSGRGPFTIQPDASIDVKVEFVPLTRGAKKAVLRLVTQSGIEYAIRLIGEAIPTPTFLGADIVDIGSHDIDKDAIIPIVIRGLYTPLGITARFTSSFPFTFRSTEDTTITLPSVFIEATTEDSLTADTVYVNFIPRDTIGYETQLVLSSGSSERTYLVRGKGRQPTQPRLLVENELLFDTIQSGDFQERRLLIKGFNLTENLQINVSEHFYIRNPDDSEVAQITLAPASLIDTNITIRFRPTNVLGEIEGMLQIRSAEVQADIPLRQAAVVARPGITIAESLLIPETRVGLSASVQVPLIGALLEPSSRINITLDAPSVYEIEYQGQRYASGEEISIPVGNGVVVQPQVTLHFTPTEQAEVYGVILFNAMRADGLEVGNSTALTGIGVLPPSFTTSRDSVPFGRVTLFEIAAELIEMEGQRLADTVQVILEQKNPMFTFSVGENSLLQEFTFNTDAGNFDNELVVVFEPTDYGFFNDTLRITSGEIVRRIPLFGIGADTTTSVEDGTELAKVRIFPTISSGEVHVNIHTDESVISPLVQIYSLLGEKILQLQPEYIGDRYFRSTLDLRAFPRGMYIVRTVLPSGKITSAKIILR